MFLNDDSEISDAAANAVAAATSGLGGNEKLNSLFPVGAGDVRSSSSQ